jgi:hypothetical protein
MTKVARDAERSGRLQSAVSQFSSPQSSSPGLMGYLRRLLINGAQAVLNSRHAKADPWIRRLPATKPGLSLPSRWPTRWRASPGR